MRSDRQRQEGECGRGVGRLFDGGFVNRACGTKGDEGEKERRARGRSSLELVAIEPPSSGRSCLELCVVSKRGARWVGSPRSSGGRVVAAPLVCRCRSTARCARRRDRRAATRLSPSLSISLSLSRCVSKKPVSLFHSRHTRPLQCAVRGALAHDRVARDLHSLRAGHARLAA